MKNVRILLFKDIINIAANEGITGGKVDIGIWAKQNGYIKKLGSLNKHRKLLYYK